MANSKIPSKVNIVQTFSSTTRDLVLMVANNIAILTGNVYSGTNGMNQYYSIISQGISSEYRPSDATRCMVIADNAQSYGLNVLTSGSLQATMAIPANLRLTVFCAWKIE